MKGHRRISLCSHISLAVLLLTVIQWGCGSSGSIADCKSYSDQARLKYDGINWSTLPNDTTCALLSVWGSDPKNIWAVGVAGIILKYDGMIWSAQTSGTSESLNHVWGIDASNVWAVGERGALLKWNGTAWAVRPSEADNWLYALSGTDANHMWAVGLHGAIRVWNGTAWYPVNVGSVSNYGWQNIAAVGTNPTTHEILGISQQGPFKPDHYRY